MPPLVVPYPGGVAPYRLALDGIVGWHETDWPGACAVQMTRGTDPVLVFGTVAGLDAAYSEFAVCEVSERGEALGAV